MEIDVNTLRMVLAVADSASYTRAAQRLGVTQPAVSRRVAAIEQRLRAKLFRRDGNRFLPTEVGLSVCDHARQIVSLVDALPHAAQEIAHQPSGPLAIGMPAFIGEQILPRLVPAYTAKYPDVFLRFEQGIADFSDPLMSKQVDVALMYGKGVSSMIELIPLIDHELGAVLPKAWRKRAPNGKPVGNRISMRELATLPLLVPALNQGMRMIIEDAFHEAGVTPNIVMEVNGLALSRSLVRSGVGCTLLAQTSLRGRADNAAFAYADIYDPVIRWPMSMAVRKHGQPTLAARLFMQMIRPMLADLVREDQWNGKVLSEP